MHNVERIEHVLMNIKFRDWKLKFNRLRPITDMWLQWCFTAPDPINGGTFECKGRKWKLSQHMTDSEVVQTAFAAAKMALEHEAREEFSYMNRPVMRPHFDVYSLIDLCDKNAVSKRKEVA